MKKKLAIGILIIFLIFICICYFFHPFLHAGRVAHISIDDVSKCFISLSEDSMKYGSIFDEPFFRYLKELHEDYDCSVTCYCFENDGDFDVSQVPIKYARELADNSDWLKFGFHGIKPMAHRPINVKYSEFTTAFSNFQKAVERFASCHNLATMLRLDYFYATPSEVVFLRNNGVRTLLSADDDRRNYYLPFQKNRQLIHKNSIEYEGIKYLRTNIRIENIDFPYFNILKNRNRDTLVIFTHEWKLDNLNKYKLKRTIKILKEQNYIFICE